MHDRNAGFTLVEFLIVAVLGVLILGAVVGSLSMQNRTFLRQEGVISAQGASRTAADMLAGELREVSATGGDVVAAAEDSMAIRAIRDVGFVCSKGAALQIDVWELGQPFEAGDSILIFANNDVEDDDDDEWVQAEVALTGTSVDATNCVDWPKTTLRGDPDGNFATRRLTVVSAGLGGVTRGAPVRSFERITYGRYVEDGEQVLGRKAPDGTLTPLIGPLAAAADSGLVISYYRVDGTEIGSPVPAAKLDSIGYFTITATGLAPAGSLAEGGEYSDRLRVSVFLRNNDPTLIATQ